MPSSLNGTGVTFNDGSTLQSGNIPSANLGSGTANSNTFLRGDRTFATPPSQAPTTAQVLSATAGASVGAVGTYAFLGQTDSLRDGIQPAGATLGGSRLRFAGISGAGSDDNRPTVSALFANGGTPSGTWRCMGRSENTNVSSCGYTLWLRIS